MDVDIVKFNQTNYVVLVPENKNNTEPILDIDSDAERLGVPVIYSLSSSYCEYKFICRLSIYEGNLEFEL